MGNTQSFVLVQQQVSCVVARVGHVGAVGGGRRAPAADFFVYSFLPAQADQAAVNETRADADGTA